MNFPIARLAWIFVQIENIYKRKANRKLFIHKIGYGIVVKFLVLRSNVILEKY